MHKWQAWRLARKMLHNGATMDHVRNALGNRYSESQILEGVRQLRAVIKADHARAAEKLKAAKAAPEIALQPIRLVERHTSITALVFGDPLPGRSALDRRQQCCSR